MPPLCGYKLDFLNPLVGRSSVAIFQHWQQSVAKLQHKACVFILCARSQSLECQNVVNLTVALLFAK
jgi:hypothetical protein